jgi:uncharacterized membrane protein
VVELCVGGEVWKKNYVAKLLAVVIQTNMYLLDNLYYKNVIFLDLLKQDIVCEKTTIVIQITHYV